MSFPSETFYKRYLLLKNSASNPILVLALFLCMVVFYSKYFIMLKFRHFVISWHFVVIRIVNCFVPDDEKNEDR